MTNTPATAPDTELFDLAARLLNRDVVDPILLGEIVHVSRRANGQLVVLLASGQKYVFDPEQVALQVGKDLQAFRAQLAPDHPPAVSKKKAHT